MSTLTQKQNPSKTRTEKADSPPLRLKTTEEVRVYLANHLTPVSFGPKGQPIYAHKDLAKLNVIFPDVE